MFEMIYKVHDLVVKLIFCLILAIYPINSCVEDVDPSCFFDVELAIINRGVI